MMEEFYKQLNKGLEHRDELEFRPEDWEKMNQKLDAGSKSDARLFGWWWIGLPILFLLLGGNIYLLTKLNQTSQRLEQLDFGRDTIYFLETIHQHDTIFQVSTIYIQEAEPQTSLPILKASTSGLSFPFNNFSPSNRAPIPYYNPPSKYSTFPYPTERFSNPWNSKGLIGEIGEEALVDLSLLEEIARRRFYPVSEDIKDWLLHQSNIPVEEKKKKFNLANQFQSTRIGVGAKTGTLIVLSRNLESRIGFEPGGEVEFQLGEHLSIWASYQYQQIKIETPIDSYQAYWITPPSIQDDFLLEKIEGYSSATNFGGGLRYRFKKSRSGFQPFLGAGVTWTKPGVFQVEYKYINQLTSEETEIKDNSIISPLSLIQNVQFETGIQYFFRENWAVGSTLSYSFPLAKDADQLWPGLIHANVGLKYYFN